jgi:K+-sensing histidine kinase KdpD
MASISEQRHQHSGLSKVCDKLGLTCWLTVWRVGLRPQSASSFSFALACVAAATLIRLVLGFLSPDSTVFAPHYSATLVAALVGGASAGALAAAIGGVVALCLFVPPEWGFAPFLREQTISALLFAASSVVIIWAAGSYRGLLRRLREEEASRELLNRELNHRIKNLLASVQAILYQTLRDNKEIRDQAIARVTCLVATNAVLATSNWHSGKSLPVSLARMVFRDFVSAARISSVRLRSRSY